MWRILSDFASVLAGLTANRIIKTNGSKQLETPAALDTDQTIQCEGLLAPYLRADTSAGVLIENSSGGDVALIGAGGGTGTTFYGGVVLDAETASRIVTTGASKDLDTPATVTTAQAFSLSGAIDTTAKVDSQIANATTSTINNRFLQSITLPSNSADNYNGVIFQCQSASGSANNYTNATFGIVGANGSAFHRGTGVVTTLRALAVEWGALNASGTISTATGLWVRNPTVTGTITTQHGLKIENITGAGTNYAIQTGSGLVEFGGNVTGLGAIKSSAATSGIGYDTGAGGTVTQITSRSTGVTLNKVCGQITLVSAAGSAAWTSFTVTNSAVATTDVIRVCQDSGTDKYQIHVTAVGAGSFEITFATTGGTTVEQPVFNFAVIKAVTA